LPEGSVLTRDRVADGEDEGTSNVILGENEEAVAGGAGRKGVVKPGDTLELTVGGPVIKYENVFAVSKAVSVSTDDR
jgi:hypothetical protein